VTGYVAFASQRLRLYYCSILQPRKDDNLSQFCRPQELNLIPLLSERRAIQPTNNCGRITLIYLTFNITFKYHNAKSIALPLVSLRHNSVISNFIFLIRCILCITASTLDFFILRFGCAFSCRTRTKKIRIPRRPSRRKRNRRTSQTAII